MKRIKLLFAVAGCLALLALSTNNAAAQRQRGGGAGFDPAAMRQQQMDRIKTAMDVSDENEWKVLEAAITKVLDARQAMGNSRGGAMARGGGRRNNNNADANGGGTTNAAPRRGGGTPDADMEALQAALDAKAPADEIKAKLGKVRDSAKAKEAKLVSAQSDLQKLLTPRQEAVAVTLALLK